MTLPREQVATAIAGWRPKLMQSFELMAQTVVGQRVLMERLMMGAILGGHILVEGVPGLAKTTAIKTLAGILHASFARVQFTPDLMPADILGMQVYEPQAQSFSIKRGPIFHHLLLADEINRAPAKVQSALLEAMQELQVTIGGDTFPLPSPFLVMATQNPLEQEGTYPLPEAQLDRFLFKVQVSYPSFDEEIKILSVGQRQQVSPVSVFEPADLLAMRDVVKSIHVDTKLNHYIVSLVHATRDPSKIDAKLKSWIACGASPRASLSLLDAARCQAFFEGRAFVIPEDIKVVAPDVMRHRLIVDFAAKAEGITPDQIIKLLLDRVAVL